MRGGGLGVSSERRAYEGCGIFFFQEKGSGTTYLLEGRGVGEAGVWVWGLMEAGLLLRG